MVQALSVAYVDILEFCFKAKAVFRNGRRPFSEFQVEGYPIILTLMGSLEPSHLFQEDLETFQTGLWCSDGKVSLAL